MSTSQTAARRLRLAVLGLGFAGRLHVRSALANPAVELVAVADPMPVKDVELPAEVVVHKEWRALLEDARIEAWSICVPHMDHVETAVAALEAGKDVLLEKPIARNLAEARVIVEAARRCGRTLMMEMTHRFYPPVAQAGQMVRAGKLGRVLEVKDKILEAGAGNLPAWLKQTAQAGGGVALTNGIHMLDRMAWVAGQPLRFHEGTIGYGEQLGDIEDAAWMRLSLADGTPAEFRAGWRKEPGKMDDELTVVGERGTLRVYAWRGWRWEPKNGAVEEQESYGGREAALVGIGAALGAFVEAVAAGQAAPVPGEEVLRAHEIIERFYGEARGS